MKTKKKSTVTRLAVRASSQIPEMMQGIYGIRAVPDQAVYHVPITLLKGLRGATVGVLKGAALHEENQPSSIQNLNSELQSLNSEFGQRKMDKPR